MVVAIIVGFKYSDRLILPGVHHDLQLASASLHPLVTHTYLISDLNVPSHYAVEGRTMASGLKKRLKSLVAQHESIILYYSGHGVDGHWKLPDQSLLSVTKIFSLFRSTKLLAVFDCCGLGRLPLPYYYRHAQHRSFSRATYPREIVVITSSDAVNESISTAQGSLFTRCFFALFPGLTDLIRLSANIHSQLDHVSTMVIWSTDPLKKINLEVGNQTIRWQ